MAILFTTFDFLAPKYMFIICLFDILILSVPDEGAVHTKFNMYVSIDFGNLS